MGLEGLEKGYVERLQHHLGTIRIHILSFGRLAVSKRGLARGNST